MPQDTTCRGHLRQVDSPLVQNQLENVATEKQALLERWIMERKADMEVLAGTSAVKEMDPAEVAPYFELVGDQYGVYRRFIITDLDGKVVYDSEGSSDASCASEVWCQRAISGQPYMSEIELAATEQESIFRLATPIRGPEGRVHGVLCAAVSTQAIVAGVLRVNAADMDNTTRRQNALYLIGELKQESLGEVALMSLPRG